MEKRRVVITGLGMLSPIGNTTAATWEAACAGRGGIGPVTRFDTAAFTVRIAGEVKGFDGAAFIHPKEVRKLDLFSQYAIAASQEAWDDAHLATAPYAPERMGCVLGVGIGGLGALEENHSAYLERGPRRISPFLIPMLVSNLAPGHLAIRYGLRGINYVTTSACASSTHAIGESYRLVANGSHDLMLTGGAESTITPIGIGGFAAMKAISTRNDEPERASRPFDRDRDGFVVSEGSAILVLEELDAARKRNATIYGEILGYGYSCDAFHITAPSSDGAGAVTCMARALADAGLRPADIDYINTHGTSTPVGDLSETRAVKQLFGAYAREGLLVSSTKSMTGHLLGAAGAVEAAFCVLAIRDGIVPPTINLDDPDEECDLDYVPHTARKAPIARAMSNSFGFGGTNASLIVGAV